MASKTIEPSLTAYLQPMINPVFLNHWMQEIGKFPLDPAIPALFNHVVEWGNRKQNSFKIVHDRSKPILSSMQLFHDLMASAEDQLLEVGYDRRKFTFPLRATSLVEGDSKLIPQLQVADICAGCINHFLKCQAAEVSDKLTEAILAQGCEEWVINAVLPGTEVTPQELGIDESGMNPIDPMVSHLRERSDKK
jgi:hypothetical protein